MLAMTSWSGGVSTGWVRVKNLSKFSAPLPHWKKEIKKCVSWGEGLNWRGGWILRFNPRVKTLEVQRSRKCNQIRSWPLASYSGGQERQRAAPPGERVSQAAKYTREYCCASAERSGGNTFPQDDEYTTKPTYSRQWVSAPAPQETDEHVRLSITAAEP